MPSALKVVQGFYPKVTSVVDASFPLVIEVTAKDVNMSATKEHDNCAVAMACKRKFKLDGAIISRSMAYLIKGSKARRFQLPPSVQKELISFDRGGGFEPGTYELGKPKSKLLGRKKGPSPAKTGPKKNKRFRHVTANMRASLVEG